MLHVNKPIPKWQVPSSCLPQHPFTPPSGDLHVCSTLHNCSLLTCRQILQTHPAPACNPRPDVQIASSSTNGTYTSCSLTHLPLPLPLPLPLLRGPDRLCAAPRTGALRSAIQRFAGPRYSRHDPFLFARQVLGKLSALPLANGGATKRSLPHRRLPNSNHHRPTSLALNDIRHSHKLAHGQRPKLMQPAPKVCANCYSMILSTYATQHIVVHGHLLPTGLTCARDIPPRNVPSPRFVQHVRLHPATTCMSPQP